MQARRRKFSPICSNKVRIKWNVIWEFFGKQANGMNSVEFTIYLSEFMHFKALLMLSVCCYYYLLVHTHRILGLLISKMLIRHLYDLCHMWKVNSLFLFFLFLIRKMSPHYMASILVTMLILPPADNSANCCHPLLVVTFQSKREILDHELLGIL